jgi:hypothetical protein
LMDSGILKRATLPARLHQSPLLHGSAIARKPTIWHARFSMRISRPTCPTTSI